MPYIFSTLTCDNAYTHWEKSADNQQVQQRSVTVKGGNGVMNKNFITPQGVMTEVTDEELAFLESVYAFQEHVKNGFIVVEKKAAAPEKVKANMKQKDESAPITPADYANGRMGVKEPTVTGGN